MVNNNAASALGRAWGFHRGGQNDAALTEFERILRQSPDDIDANFGVGLVQRALGQHDAAIASFRKAIALTEKALAAEPGADRWEMLLRMTHQRLSETQRRQGA